MIDRGGGRIARKVQGESQVRRQGGGRSRMGIGRGLAMESKVEMRNRSE